MAKSRIAKRVFAAASTAGLCALGTAVFAMGPVSLGPVSAPIAVPKILVTSTVQTSLETKALAAYRQIRTFWLSRAIVR